METEGWLKDPDCENDRASTRMMAKMKCNLINRGSAICTLMLLSLTFAGCARHAESTEPATEPATAESSPKPTPRTQFEQDLQYVRNGQFTYVWIFARKDGKPLDKDDGDYLRKNAPQVVDWVGTDEGKKIMGGTNFDLAQGNLELLKKRFIVEDYSNK